MRRLGITGAAIVWSCLGISSCLWAGPLDDYVRDVLEKHAAMGRSVLLAECRTTSGKAMLFFGLGEPAGLFVEMSQGVVVNVADVGVEHTGPVIRDSHGGVFTVNRVGRLVRALLANHFRFLLPQAIEGMLISVPDRVCPEP